MNLDIQSPNFYDRSDLIWKIDTPEYNKTTITVHTAGWIMLKTETQTVINRADFADKSNDASMAGIEAAISPLPFARYNYFREDFYGRFFKFLGAQEDETLSFVFEKNKFTFTQDLTAPADKRPVHLVVEYAED